MDKIQFKVRIERNLLATSFLELSSSPKSLPGRILFHHWIIIASLHYQEQHGLTDHLLIFHPYFLALASATDNSSIQTLSIHLSAICWRMALLAVQCCDEVLPRIFKMVKMVKWALS